MSLVTTRLGLTHRCTILRDANAGTSNGRGNPNPADWQPNATDVPCFFWATSGRERAADSAQVVNIDQQRLLLGLDADITEDDMISAITDRGATIAAGPIQIHSLLRNPDHFEVVLVQIGA
jgi:hypothetical protein